MNTFEKKMMVGMILTAFVTILGFAVMSYGIGKVWDAYEEAVAVEKSKFMDLCTEDEKEYKCEVLWNGSR